MGAFARHSRYGSVRRCTACNLPRRLLGSRTLRTKPRRAAGLRRRSPRSERTLPLARHRSAQLRQHCARQNPPAAQRVLVSSRQFAARPAAASGARAKEEARDGEDAGEPHGGRHAVQQGGNTPTEHG